MHGTRRASRDSLMWSHLVVLLIALGHGPQVVGARAALCISTSPRSRSRGQLWLSCHARLAEMSERKDPSVPHILVILLFVGLGSFSDHVRCVALATQESSLKHRDRWGNIDGKAFSRSLEARLHEPRKVRNLRSLHT
jgi:hypothetical protein